MKHTASAASGYALRFLNWWGRELSASAQDLRARVVPHWRRRLNLFVSRSRLQIVEDGTGNGSPILDVMRTEPGSELPPLSDAQRDTLGRGRRARLVLDPELAFVRALRMPLAALPHLASAIDLQAPKLLPMSATLLRRDFEIAAVDPDGAAVDIELAAIKRSDIEPIESALEQWGLQPGAVQLGRASDSRFRFNFGMSNVRGNRFAFTRADTFLAAGAAALAMGVVIICTVQAVRARNSLEQALAQTSAPAASVLQQRQHLISRLDTLSAVSTAERAPTAAAILADVTSRMNHNTWLTTFELKGRELRLVGLSSEPASVVKELAASTLILEVELRSSMSASGSTGRERFEITARVKTDT
jgi:hypothetical protein